MGTAFVATIFSDKQAHSYMNGERRHQCHIAIHGHCMLEYRQIIVSVVNAAIDHRYYKLHNL